MSHFTVLVIGPDPEKQLQPFHEFECTGIDDEFVQDVDESAEVREWLAEDPTRTVKQASDWFGGTLLEGDGEPDRAGAHQYGWMRIDASGQFVERIRRTNPNRKWDWYVLGGRWTGFFRVKQAGAGSLGRPGLMTSPAEAGTVDQARAGDIDFDAMRAEAAAEANKEFDAYLAARQKHDVPDTVIGWQATLAMFGIKPEGLPSALAQDFAREDEAPIDAARRFYKQQHGIREVERELKAFFDCVIDNFGTDRAAYVRRCEDNRIRTFAVLRNGKWFERGRMGWFGHVADEKSESAWDEQYRKLLDDLPPDTLLSVFDCHI